ncbi:hypothetical protein HER21_46785, partial [Pseudomonas sp. BGM005]|nr:hypothetical protein [Pseudomonas sp. BG5]
MFTDPGASSFAGLGLLAAAGVGITIAIVSWRRSRVARYRLDAFARANGMSYEARAANPALPGMLFGLGRSREATDLVRGTQP